MSTTAEQRRKAASRAVKARPGKELNERQQRFVWEYLKDFDGAAAYKRAGYKTTGNSAEAAASRLLRQVKVRTALARARAEVAERTLVDKEFVMGQLRQNLERAMQITPVLDKEGNPIGVFTYQGAVANKALELMGKELGMFGDKLELSGGREPIKQITVVKTVRAEQEIVEPEPKPEPKQRAVIPASEAEAEAEDPIFAMHRRYRAQMVE